MEKFQKGGPGRVAPGVLAVWMCVRPHESCDLTHVNSVYSSPILHKAFREDGLDVPANVYTARFWDDDLGWVLINEHE